MKEKEERISILKKLIEHDQQDLQVKAAFGCKAPRRRRQKSW
ncbi:MAG: hypothetical protein QNJ58_18455 [Desulfobacterales bacterium]|nr:hypothetical protein [Desulfobacterales bacterium]